jgi:hypothetical protein
VTAASDMDEKSVEQSSTSPAVKQNTIAVRGCHSIKSLPKHIKWLTARGESELYTAVAVFRSMLQSDAFLAGSFKDSSAK